jgi:integrase
MPSTDPSRKHHKTGTPGVFWRGTDKDRRYEVTWRCYGTCDKHDKQGQHWERSHGKYDDAIKLLETRKREVQELRARVQRGEQIGERPERSFKQVADEYLASRTFGRLAPGTQKKYREALELRILPRFGETAVADITADDIASWLYELRGGERRRRRGKRTHGLSESTINAALSPLRCVFKLAASRSKGYIAVSPLAALEDDELPKPGTDARPVQVLDEREIERLLEAAPEPFRLMLEVKAGTGLRSAELRALTWGDVDEPRKRIVVSRQIDTDDRGRREAIKDRSLAESRFVPLTEALLERLLDRRARMAEYELAGPDDFVFGDGRHVKHGQLDEAFRTAVETAGIKRDPDKRLSPRALRHSYGSLLLARGEQVSTVSAWLGHRKISTTEKWYAHQIETLLDVAAERMRERERERLEC